MDRIALIFTAFCFAAFLPIRETRAANDPVIADIGSPQGLITPFLPASPAFVVRMNGLDVARICGASLGGSPEELGPLEHQFRELGIPVDAPTPEIEEAVRRAFYLSVANLRVQTDELARRTEHPEDVSETDFATRIRELDFVNRNYRAYVGEQGARVLADRRNNLHRHFVTRFGEEIVAALLAGSEANASAAAVPVAVGPSDRRTDDLPPEVRDALHLRPAPQWRSSLATLHALVRSDTEIPLPPLRIEPLPLGERDRLLHELRRTAELGGAHPNDLLEVIGRAIERGRERFIRGERRTALQDVEAIAKRLELRRWAEDDESRRSAARERKLSEDSSWYEIVTFSEDISRKRAARAEGLPRNARWADMAHVHLDDRQRVAAAALLGLPKFAPWSTIGNEAIRIDSARELGLSVDAPWERIRGRRELAHLAELGGAWPGAPPEVVRIAIEQGRAARIRELAASFAEALEGQSWADNDAARRLAAQQRHLPEDSSWYDIVSSAEDFSRRRAARERGLHRFRLDEPQRVALAHLLRLPDFAEWSTIRSEAIRIDSARKFGLNVDASWEAIKTAEDRAGH